MKTNKLFKKAVSIALTLAIAISCVYAPSFKVKAAENAGTITSAYGGTNNKFADSSSLNDWKKFFGPDKLDTTYAGSIWTDKSVFSSAEDYVAATDEEDNVNTLGLKLNDSNNFLVALSTIASSKSVEGYDALPSDTVLVLDLSASMITNQAVASMVQATNDAITKLQALNANNRVGVVAYSGNSQEGYSSANTASIILPLGRYTAGLNAQGRSAYLVSNWTTGNFFNSVNHTGVKVAPGTTGVLAEGTTGTFSTSNSKDATGGTYIQNGLYKAWQLVENVKDTVLSEGLQAGTKRIPVMVLLSDGAPTTASTTYTNIGESDSGSGTSSYATAGTAFMTQLTASWVRDKLEQKYGNTPLLYTLGLNVGNSDSAKSVLDPSNTTSTDEYWEDFIDLANKSDKTMQVQIRNGNNSSYRRTITYTEPVLSSGWREGYVTEYFPANNASGLISSFDKIVQKIIIQSLYYPTMVEGGNSINEDGFIEFEDFIGDNMEVKAVKGIQLGTKLYNGSTFAKLVAEGGMGTEENPTDTGNNFVWSVQKRFGIATVSQARALIKNAFDAGQLYYNGATGEFSNYIGWYADVDGKFISFWDGTYESLSSAPANAVFADKSYFFYDAVGEGHRKTDMMYATILVRETIKDVPENPDASDVGDIKVIGKLPASLIPIVEYDIDLDGTDPMNPEKMEIIGASAPSRLLYEVGFDSRIDPLNFVASAPDSLLKDGENYVFYTNQWHALPDEEAGEHFNYGTNKNTIARFEPSLENERYYYNYDTPIYEATSGGYQLYVGENAPQYSANKPYYHRFIIYSVDNGAVSAQYKYERVSEYVLTHSADDLVKLSDNSWVVKKGTIHHYFGGYEVTKQNNLTNTIAFSEKTFVHEPDEGIKEDYHVSAYLGNNGKLLVNPIQGIKISKIADAQLENRTQSYDFVIGASASDYNKSHGLYLEKENGERNHGTIQFVNGEASVFIAHGETAYIVGDDLTGETFNVYEKIPSAADYELYSINDDTAITNIDITVEEDVVKGAVFVNNRKNTTVVVNPLTVDMTVYKILGGDYKPLQAGAFEFVLTDESGNTVYDREFNGAPVNDKAPINFSTTIYSEGTYVYKIREVMPQGANLQNGYTVNGVTYSTSVFTVTVTVTNLDNDENFEYNIEYAQDNPVFVNTYNAEDTSVSFNAEKILIGDSISKYTDANAFVFELYEASWDESAQSVVQGNMLAAGKNDANGNIVFENLDKITYDTIGAYRYILREAIPANGDPLMDYDKSVYHIEVDVTDDLAGKLVASVNVTKVDESGNLTVLSENDKITFTNVLSPESVKVNIEGEKRYNKDLEGDEFAFELYQAMKVESSGEIIAIGDALLTAKNDGDGKFKFEEVLLKDALSGLEVMSEYLTFDSEGEYYFVVKEAIPLDVDANNYKNGIYYDADEYVLTVQITKSVVNGRDTLSEKVLINGASEGDVVFVNTYTAAQSGDFSIEGTKVLKDGTLEDGEYTFDLYSAKLDGNKYVADAFIAEKQNINGAFKFDEVQFKSYDLVGTHHYIVKERIPQEADENDVYNRVKYDNSEYLVTVLVTDNGDGTLKVESQITLEGQVKDIEFVNEYIAPDPVEFTIKGTKVLTGQLPEGEIFTFELHEANMVGQEIVAGALLDTAQAREGEFEFEKITANGLGVLIYVVKEYIPDGADQNNTFENVTYDAREHVVVLAVDEDNNGDYVITPNYFVGNEAVQEIKFENIYTAPQEDEKDPEDDGEKDPEDDGEKDPEDDGEKDPEDEGEDDRNNKPKPQKPTAPNTGEGDQLNFALVLLVVSLGAVITTSLLAKKKEGEQN